MKKLLIILFSLISISYSQEYFCVYVKNLKKNDLEKFSNVYSEKADNTYKIGFTTDIQLLRKIKLLLEKNYKDVFIGYCKPSKETYSKVNKNQNKEKTSKDKSQKENILNFYKTNLLNLKKLYNQLTKPNRQNFKIYINEDLYTNFLKTQNKIQSLISKTNTSKFNFILGADYNSSQVLADDRYPFVFRFFAGIKFPLLKGGYLERKYNEEFARNINSIRNQIPIYPVKSLSDITFDVFEITKQNQYVINKHLVKFLKDLSAYIEGISKYDKYYVYLLNSIKLIKNQTPKEYLIFTKSLKNYSFCIVDDISVKEILEKKEKNLIKSLKNLKEINRNYLLLNSKADFQVRYNYRDSFEDNLNNDYLSLVFNLDIPFYASSSELKKLDKLKFLEKEKKAIYEFYRIKTSINTELLNQLQNYYLYKNHLIEFEIILNNIQRRISLVELGIDELNLEQITNLFRKAYNQLNIINLYKQRLLLSYLKIQKLIKQLDKSSKIYCKMEQ